MYRLTSHASRDRQGAGTWVSPVDDACGLSPRIRGSQARRAAMVKATPQARAVCQEPGRAWESGAEIPEETAAVTPMTVTYRALTPRMRCAGTLRRIRAGSSTLPNAMAAERITVPANRQNTEGSDRITVPAASTARAATSSRAVPNRCEARATRGDVAANVSSGRVLSSPPQLEVRPLPCSIAGSSVPTPVRLTRRFAATRQIATTSPIDTALPVWSAPFAPLAAAVSWRAMEDGRALTAPPPPAAPWPRSRG